VHWALYDFIDKLVVAYTGWPKKVNHSRIIIKSYLKTPLRLHFSSILSIKCAQACYNFVLCDLTVTSSVTTFEAATWIKSMYMAKSWLKPEK